MYSRAFFVEFTRQLKKAEDKNKEDLKKLDSKSTQNNESDNAKKIK